jgi:hypothetical protein
MSIFATQDVKVGDIVLCEKAFVAVAPHDRQARLAHIIVRGDGQLLLSGKYDVALWKNLVDKITRNKSTSHRLNDLAEMGGILYTAPSIGADDDVFLMLKRAQVNTSMMIHSAPDTVNENQGLFVYASHINHSCTPNTARAFIGNFLVVRASRSIKAGEQIFGSRSQLLDNFEQTQAFLSRTQKAPCECAICVAEQ